jgi:hypothetical protein
MQIATYVQRIGSAISDVARIIRKRLRLELAGSDSYRRYVHERCPYCGACERCGESHKLDCQRKVLI